MGGSALGLADDDDAHRADFFALCQLFVATLHLVAMCGMLSFVYQDSLSLPLLVCLCRASSNGFSPVCPTVTETPLFLDSTIFLRFPLKQPSHQAFFFLGSW